MSQHQITCVHKDGTVGIVTEFKSWTPVVQWADGAEPSSNFSDLKQVVYRSCEISQGMSAYAPIVFSHATFDGAPDSGTRGRCGYCERFGELMSAIDEMIELYDLEPETERTLIDVAIDHFTEYRDQTKAAVLTAVNSTQEIIHREREITLDGCIAFLKGLQKA